MEEDHGITIEVVRDESGLERLAPEWTALNARCGPEGFFTRMEVVRANWARHKDDARTSLHILAMRKEGRLVFAAPMIRRRDVLGTHALCWLDSKTPFYDDVLLDPDMDPALAARFFKRHLFASWMRRVLKIGHVREGTPLHRVLVAGGIPLTFRTVAPTLDISAYGTWDAYLSTFPAKRRQQFGNYSRRLQRAGAEPVRLVTDPDERRAEIARLFARKREWVAEKELSDWIVPAETEAWFQRIAVLEDARNRAHVLRLAAGKEWIASCLAFERDGTMFSSKMAFNPEWERFSPGWILVLEKIRFAFGRGLSTVDFMIGRNQWKERLADGRRSIFTCRTSLLPWRRGRSGESG